MTARRFIALFLLGLAGLLVAVGVTTAATELTSQRIGLQEEPLNAGDDLAPAAVTQRERPQRTTATTPETASPPATTTQQAPPPPATTAEPETESEDDGGRGRGRGRNRGGGDDDDD